MKNIIKNSFNSTATAVCMLCVLFWGCDTAFDGKGDELINMQLKSAENPYYVYDYNGNKVFFALNTRYAFLSVEKPELPANFEQYGIIASEFSDNQNILS